MGDFKGNDGVFNTVTFGSNDSVFGHDPKSYDLVICKGTKVINQSTVWQDENPLGAALATIVANIVFVLGFTRFLLLLLRYLYQPRFVAEMIAGILISPHILGLIPSLYEKIMPISNVMTLETVGNLGLVYSVFLVGLEMDLTVAWRGNRKALTFALAGVVFSFAIGTILPFILKTKLPTPWSHIYWGAALSFCGFTVLTRLLAKLKLLHADLGRLAMSASTIADLLSWFLFMLAVSSSGNGKLALLGFPILAAFAGFLVFCARPFLKWAIGRVPEGENLSSVFVYFVLAGVLICGLATDLMGFHSITGALLFGLVVPKGEVAIVIAENSEDFVRDLLLPLYFVSAGSRVNVNALTETEWYRAMVVVVVAFSAKIISAFGVGCVSKMPPRDSFALGLLMNTKSVIAVVVIKIGMDYHALDVKTYTIMVMAILTMTIFVGPLVHIFCRPTRSFIFHKHRTIQSVRDDSAEFRLLTCIHDSRNVSSMISLMEASNPTEASPLLVFALHLVELTGRASAMLIVHSTRKSGYHNPSNRQLESNNILNALEGFEEQCPDISIQPLTAMSPYSTMHEDIYGLAEDKRVTLILMPFHQQLTVEGKMEDVNPAYRILNQNVMSSACCSVGILCDRGLGSLPRMDAGGTTRRVGMIYIGGSDDREALSYCLRMAEHPRVSLDVVRFIPGAEALDCDAMEQYLDDEGGMGILDIMAEYERQRCLDDDFLGMFKNGARDKQWVGYKEVEASGGEQVLETIKEMGHNEFDLYVVGKGQGYPSPLTWGLSEWSDCPELGAIGDALVSFECAKSVSVLVIQQYQWKEIME